MQTNGTHHTHTHNSTLRLTKHTTKLPTRLQKKMRITTHYHHRRTTTQHRQEETSRCNHFGLFDTVAHNKLISKLQNYEIQGKTNKWIYKWLKFRNQTVVLDGGMSDPVPVTSGVPQGTVLGPLMFLLYINDINQNINSKIRLFAGDCVLYRKINSKLDCLELQQDLQKLVDWSHRWQMYFNINKCHTLHAHRKKQPIIRTYTMDNTPVTPITHHPYLGIELQSDLR